ncbi:NADH:ubiquinone reductase (Na(+)-transporting) subunit C [Prosthecochloris sp. CIB 2401]|uniref:NADH:ubiquinone reductase (Na(+)-transporting) subunit C n=1 Tax=Prosthecochloris sp. CIB 2401 TaxID=1868325 RepID=UPI00080ABAED|nr:NADH:ubiquinone reductase (Na(+)-transporting) subunit C [Prosthecochloris sp. CIB 2401]ANT65896.1 Na(+)-translocating NADH-quinone reductase subunit C [Prosthecochloris sp. CIB 2401]
MPNSNRYTYMFVALMALVSALLLSLVKTGLHERQEFNRELDMKKNIMMAAGAYREGMSGQEVADAFKRGFAIKRLSGAGRENVPAYYVYGEEPAPEAVILPVDGKGLWSTIKGFIALESDLNTVRGIAFYEHAETPGLGGEIDKEYFTRRFQGKKIFREGQLVSVTIAKGEMLEESDYGVDGISGASLTTAGINRFLRADLERFTPLLQGRAQQQEQR